jgi:hypothetical protein
LKKDIARALLGIFDVYKAFPGIAAIELLILNHFQILRWLWQCATLTSASGVEGVADEGGLSRRVDIEEELFEILLQSYFLGVERQNADLTDLRNWVAAKRDATLPRWIVEIEEDTRFQQAVGQRLRRTHVSADERERKSNKVRRVNPESEEHYTLELKDLHPHSPTSGFHFGAQDRGAPGKRLAAVATDDPRRAGTAKRSSCGCARISSGSSKAYPRDSLLGTWRS